MAERDESLRAHFAGKRVLITGGLGFIGSSLALALADCGAELLLVDSMLPDQGGNEFNIEPIASRVRVNINDICNEHAMRFLVRDQDLIFNLAASLSHAGSMEDPYTDLENNCRGHLSVLEACKKENREVKIVFAGTRSQYGRALVLPVDEQHPLRPLDVNGVHNIAAEACHFLYHSCYGIRATSLRMTNAYGPRQQMKHGRQGFFNWFLRRALDDETIAVYGDGRQLRDYNYVDDIVRALMLAAKSEAADGEAFNLGCDTPLSVREIAERIVQAAGRGRVECVPYPPSAQMVEVGDFYCDFRRIRGKLGWQPLVPLDDGLAQTIAYYRQYREHYWQ